MLSTNEMIISVVFAVSLAGILAYVFWIQRKQAKQGPGAVKPEASGASSPLKLQAYERLILLADRIALPNLIGRCNQAGLTVREMQNLLTRPYVRNLITTSPSRFMSVRKHGMQSVI